jgi:hypothetical protein
MVITTSDAWTASTVSTLGFLAEMSIADLLHGLDHDGVDVVGWSGAGGADLDAALAEVGEEGGAHLRAATLSARSCTLDHH